MKKKHFLIHYDEIALKGKNRPDFEKRLADNIRLIAQNKNVKVEIKRLWGRFLLITNASEKKTSSILEKVFGIAWFSPVLISPPSVTKIKERTSLLAKQFSFSSFAIRARVADKSLSLKRKNLEIELGNFVVKNFKKSVSLEDPQLTFYIEVADKNHVFVFTKKHLGPGGLPTGSSGKAICLISGGIDSPVAGYLMMGRGLQIDFVHCHSYPKTSKTSIQKVTELIKILSGYQPKFHLHLVPILNLQKQMFALCNNRYLVVLYRRAMLRIGELIAEKEKASTLITGDALGQVASQTVENLAVQNQAIELPILRPLISFKKQKIIDLAQKINTYSTSILPHQDCCSLFVPKHPSTKTRIENILEEENRLNYQELISSCLEEVQTVDYPEKKIS